MVLERSEGLRQEGTSLGLLANAWRALDALSIGDELRKANPRVTGYRGCILGESFDGAPAVDSS